VFFCLPIPEVGEGAKAQKQGENMEKNKAKDVYSITEINEGKSRWVKVGAAFVNRDGSINVVLDAFPKDGKLQIRDRKPPKRA
jgi:pyoverdine/dityrosine biosynthesis protein Dit1